MASWPRWSTAGRLRCATGAQLVDGSVAIWLPNSPAFVAAFLATLRLGAIATPLGILLKPREVRARLEIAQPAVLVTTPALARELGDVAPQVLAVDPDERRGGTRAPNRTGRAHRRRRRGPGLHVGNGRRRKGRRADPSGPRLERAVPRRRPRDERRRRSIGGGAVVARARDERRHERDPAQRRRDRTDGSIRCRGGVRPHQTDAGERRHGRAADVRGAGSRIPAGRRGAAAALRDGRRRRVDRRNWRAPSRRPSDARCATATA